MDVGHSGKNNRRYINISQLLEEVTPEMVDALPGLHALTGSDYTAAFMSKGKVKPFNLIMKSPQYTHAMSQLGNQDDISSDVMLTIEAFVCALYGYPKDKDVDKVRNNMFRLKYAPQQEHDPLLKITGMNPSIIMPPCHNMLANKVKRANFVSAMWKKACTPQPVIVSPVDNGWILQDDTYIVKWYDGDQVPRALSNAIVHDTFGEEHVGDDDDVAVSSNDDDDDDGDHDDDDGEDDEFLLGNQS